ncbi:DUF6959 family protein [Anatilimnocola floriformis]|uniref:DUF6959 family protein n=1 Tax=Anatilimnocola floriformis TaxID=2948575 RepID=UPI0020C44099|nr:hypothetical protein [Anatilimnocola floriformis]
MFHETLEVYARDSNYAIIKPPGRNYPGCVIQGDSLSRLYEDVRRLAKLAVVGNSVSESMVEHIEELNNMLIRRILHYQEVLHEHGIALPYGQPFSENDLIQDEAD